MRWGLVACTTLVAACGRIGFDPEVPPAGGDAGGDAAPLVCPQRYAKLGEGCYRIVNSTSAELPFTEAEQDCEADVVGAHLAVVDDVAEQQRLFNEAGVSGIRIGIVDRLVEGDYVTVTGFTAFVTFAQGEPTGDTDDCLDLRVDGMHDADCANMDDYICEFDGEPADPTAF
jgi:hypothetical protein